MSVNAIRDIPKLSVSRELREPHQSHDPAKEYFFRYRAKNHRALPHIVKFSGGRSSGLLLFTLLENGLLDRERGDVIVFNNTSAEHPDTYRFVHDCMRAARRYGIPFFQVEFQTYEDSRRGVYTRIPSYRLVNDRPISGNNPDGFHWRGEVFQELLSWSGYVPNQFNRVCTKHLKLQTTRDFLRDWLAAKPTTPRLGHHGNGSRIDPDETYRRHRENQGAVPRDIFLKKRAYAWQRPHVRPEQNYSHFCSCWKPFDNSVLRDKTFGDKACFGRNGVEYVAFIGLRGDEPHRVQRVESRSANETEYEGEHVYMPLADMAVSKNDVNKFWDRQDWDLSLPKDLSLSNCVYCFLKGAANLRDVHRRMQSVRDTTVSGFGPIADTPCDLAWWSRVESEYGRDLEAERRTTRSEIKHIGFFGNTGFSYDTVAKGDDLGSLAETMLPCDCTE